MTHKITKEKNSKVELEVTISKEEFLKYRDQAFKSVQANIEMDGFRKGHAPESAILAKYGEESILREMSNLAINETYPQIIIEEKIKIISEPHIHIVQMEEGKDFVYHAHVHVYPEIVLPDYKSLAKEVAKTKKEIADTTDEEIKQVVDQLDEKVKAETKDLEKIIKENMKSEKEYLENTRIRNEILEKLVKATDENNKDGWPESFEDKDKAQIVVLDIAKKENISATKEEIDAETVKVMMHLNPEDLKNGKIDEVRVKSYAEQIIINEKVLSLLEK
ncbi:MAG: trigger factor [Patescibacteria group bacterium]|nr:trigger factor [Patescibacteria group bacterium]